MNPPVQPFFADPVRARALVAELDRWLGTPWMHRANTDGEQRAERGIGGDCVTIPLTALADLGFVPRHRLPAHAALPGQATDEQVEHSLAKWAARFIAEGVIVRVDRRCEPLLTGDFLSFKLRAAREHHLGVYRRHGQFWHAPGPGSCYQISWLTGSDWGPYLQSVYRLADRGGVPQVAEATP